MSHKFTNYSILALACVAALNLGGCSQSPTSAADAEVDNFLKTSSAETVSKKMRDHDNNDNGIRDVIEAKTGLYAADMTERLRYLAYAWSLQQALEVALLGDDKKLVTVSQMLTNSTRCLVANTRNQKFAVNLVEMTKMAADTPLRQRASDKLNERTRGITMEKMDKPCAQADTLAVRIVQQTKERVDAMRAKAKANQAGNPVVQDAKDEDKTAIQGSAPAAKASEPVEQKEAAQPVSGGSAPK